MKKRIFSLHIERVIKKGPLYLLVMLAVYAVSCRKKKCISTTPACAAFSDTSFDNWFPYKQGQEVVFRNSAGGEKKLSIKETSRTIGSVASSYETDCDLPTPSDLTLGLSCPYATITSGAPSNSAIGLRVTYNPSNLFVLYLDTTMLVASSVNDTGIADIKQAGRSRFNSSRYFSNYVSNGMPYGKAQVILRDTLLDHVTGIYKVVLAHGSGIIEYEEYPSRVLWRKL